MLESQQEAKLRAWWAHRQGLDGTLMGRPCAGVLEQSGWARSVGGANPYLTLFARAWLRRSEVDRAAAELVIYELPSARGCTYVVPATHFALALTLAAASSDDEMKVARKLGVTDAEIEGLCERVATVLGPTPLGTDEIREAVGGAARSLGEAGKKKGVTTTLPLALGLLQVRGEIRRVPVNGRLDQQRYRYVRWNPGPKLPVAAAAVELARLYFRWIAPATIAEFQWFSGLSLKAAFAAVNPLELTPMEQGSDRLMFADDCERFTAFKVPDEPAYAITSSMDALVLLRRDLKQLLRPEDLQRPIFGAQSLTDLPSHPIFDRGRIVGLWEFDQEAQQIVWAAFGKAGAKMEEAVHKMESFIREDLGDARGFSLDSPKSRKPRVDALRRAS